MAATYLAVSTRELLPLGWHIVSVEPQHRGFLTLVLEPVSGGLGLSVLVGPNSARLLETVRFGGAHFGPATSPDLVSLVERAAAALGLDATAAAASTLLPSAQKPRHSISTKPWLRIVIAAPSERYALLRELGQDAEDLFKAALIEPLDTVLRMGGADAEGPVTLFRRIFSMRAVKRDGTATLEVVVRPRGDWFGPRAAARLIDAVLYDERVDDDLRTGAVVLRDGKSVRWRRNL